MSLPGVPALLLLVALAAGPAGADDASDLLKNTAVNPPQVVVPEARSLEGTPERCGPLAHPALAGKICDTLDDCMALCSCACRFDKTKWADKKGDGSTTCTGLPETGVGMLPPDDATLLAVSTTMPHVKVPRGVKGIQAVLDGLQHLSDHLAASENRRRLGYTVRVGSCYRRHLEDSVPECGFTLKAKYMLDKPGNDQATIDRWRSSGDPNNLGLSWPGRTPHSGGYGCDIILVDSRGQDCFDWRAGVAGPNGPPTCSIAARDAAAYLVDEATGAGVDAKRLSFEAWHFEWGAQASGCRGADCSAWPITGKPGNR